MPPQKRMHSVNRYYSPFPVLWAEKHFSASIELVPLRFCLFPRFRPARQSCRRTPPHLPSSKRRKSHSHWCANSAAALFSFNEPLPPMCVAHKVFDQITRTRTAINVALVVSPVRRQDCPQPPPTLSWLCIFAIFLVGAAGGI